MTRTASRKDLAIASIVLAAAALATTASCGSTVTVASCDEGQTKCGAACVEVDSDPENCGACGNACGAGAICDAGVCSAASCPPGFVDCGGVCANLGSDPQNCGGCGAICPPGSICAGGTCQGSTCPPGYVDCGAGCVDINYDPANCGGCGLVCPPDTYCAEGFCQGSGCPPGYEYCFDSCTDISSDPFNCGGCGITCGPNEGCFGGVCDNPCPPGLTPCGGECVDLSVDPLHCGQCFSQCGPMQPCVAGACQGACPGGVCGLCSLQDLGAGVPITTSGSTAGAQDGVTPTCAPGGSGEIAYSFTAPISDTYTFDTFGSSFDTVLSLIDPSCMALGCNDDTMNVQSQLVTPLSAGQTVYVVVDGFAGAAGSYTLHVTGQGGMGGCPEGNLGSAVPQSVSGSTVNAGDDMAPGCGPAGGPDQAFLFTAPFSGNFNFNTAGSNFDTVLHIHAGTCSGAPLACNDDAMGVQSSITVALTAGQAVVVAVDGFGAAQGNFILNVSSN